MRCVCHEYTHTHTHIYMYIYADTHTHMHARTHMSRTSIPASELVRNTPHTPYVTAARLQPQTPGNVFHACHVCVHLFTHTKAAMTETDQNIMSSLAFLHPTCSLPQPWAQSRPALPNTPPIHQSNNACLVLRGLRRLLLSMCIVHALLGDSVLPRGQLSMTCVYSALMGRSACLHL